MSSKTYEEELRGFVDGVAEEGRRIRECTGGTMAHNGCACDERVTTRARIPELDFNGVPFPDSECASDYQVGGNHYKAMTLEPWDVIDTWPIEQRIGFFRGGALKYIMRAGSKGAAGEDIEKAKHYLEKLLEVLPR